MRIRARSNWIEPAVRFYLICAVGAFALGCLFHLVPLKMIGGILLAAALFVVGGTGLYLFYDGRL